MISIGHCASRAVARSALGTSGAALYYVYIDKVNNLNQTL